MATRSIKSGRTHYSKDAEDKERVIVELEDRIRVLENELRLRQKDLINPGIVESVRAEEALRESEARFSAFMDNSPGLAWMKDENGVYVYLNEACGERIGIGLDHGLGKTDHELFKQEVADRFRESDREVLASGRMTVLEEEAVSQDDRRIRWLCVKFPFKSASGNRYVGGIAVDITDSKRAEEALQKSEERLRRACSAGRIGLYEWNVDRDQFYFNPEAYELYGIDPGSSVTYGTWLPCLHPEDRGMVERRFAENQENARREAGLSCQIEYRVVHGDGAILWLEVSSTYALESGCLIVRGAVRDITDRKRAEDALKKSKASLARAQFITHLANWEMDVDTGQVRVSDEFYRIFNLEPDAPQEAYGEKIHPDDKAGVIESVNAAIYEGKPYSIDYRIVPRPGEVRHVHAEGKTICDVTGRPLSFFGTVQDITERKRTEEALRVSEERLRRASSAGRIGLFEWNVDRSMVYLRPEAYELYGLGPGYLATYEMWLSTVHPDDREMVERTFTEAYEKARNISHISTQLEYRTVHPDRAVLWFLATATCTIEGGDLMVRGAVRDITERKRAEEALRESEERYRELVENANSIILRFDMRGNLTFFNEYAEKLFGFSKYEVLGRNVLGTIVPQSESTGRNLNAIIEEIKRRPERYRSNVNENVCKNGDRVWIAWTNKAIHDERGNVVEILSVGNDITERRRAEEVLRESEEKFRVLAETTRAAIVLAQGNKLIYVNPTVERVLGYSRDELMAMNYWDLIHPDSMELLRSMGQLRSMGMPVPSNYELKALTKSGETRWGEFSVASIDYGDRPTTIATIFDITERKQAEEALRVSEERLRRTSRAGQIGLYEWNEDHDTVYMSPEAYELFGFEPGSTVTYEKFFERLHPEDREMFMRSSAEAREKAHNGSIGTVQSEFRVMHEDRSVLWLEATATYDLECGDVMVRGAVRDITERKRAEEELANAKAQAELYVDLMGHDINNFNMVARGYLELMDGMVEDAKLKELVAKPLEAIDSSSRLIQNVQKLQRARSGGDHMEALDLGTLVEEAAGQMGSAPDKPVDVTCHAVKGVRVRANELLRDVFANLIGNALKHSAESPHIDIRMVPEEKDGQAYCTVIIDDNGPGVPDDMKEKIFGRLSRGNTRAKGSGLGLYLVKSLVESYGGKVWVEDRVKGDHTKGARFVVMLPAVEK